MRGLHNFVMDRAMPTSGYWGLGCSVQFQKKQLRIGHTAKRVAMLWDVQCNHLSSSPGVPCKCSPAQTTLVIEHLESRTLLSAGGTLNPSFGNGGILAGYEVLGVRPDGYLIATRPNGPS